MHIKTLMMTGKWLIVLLVLGVVLIVGAGIVFWKFYYTDIEPPIINEGKTSLSKIDKIVSVGGYPVPTEVTFTVTKIIENSNPFTIEITKVEYEYYINNNFIEEGEVSHKYRIPAKDRRHIPIKIKTSPETLVSLAKAGVIDAKEGKLAIKVYTDAYATTSFRKTVIASKTTEAEIEYLTHGKTLELVKPPKLPSLNNTLHSASIPIDI